jgi:hypothetical protein
MKIKQMQLYQLLFVSCVAARKTEAEDRSPSDERSDGLKG